MGKDELPNSAVRRTPEGQLDQVLTLLRDVLGLDLVGAYLHGSAVLGGIRPRSDIDVLVVSKRGTTREEKRRLVERLLSISGDESPGQPRPVELTIVVEAEIRPWRYPPSFDFHYGEWLRSEFESGNVEPWPTTTDPDLASLITMVLLGNTPLLGPPPAEVFDPVPRDDYVSAMVGDVQSLLDHLDSDTRNVILTLARIWSTVATDVIRSKDAAAEWVLARLPNEHQAVLACARAIYRGEEEERWEDLEARVRPHVDYVVGEIERLAAGPLRPK
jgi:predicted nucleotidyltransferase